MIDDRIKHDIDSESNAKPDISTEPGTNAETDISMELGANAETDISDALKEQIREQANADLPDLWNRIEAALPKKETGKPEVRKEIAFRRFRKELISAAAILLLTVVCLLVIQNLGKGKDSAPDHVSEDTDNNFVSDASNDVQLSSKEEYTNGWINNGTKGDAPDKFPAEITGGNEISGIIPDDAHDDNHGADGLDDAVIEKPEIDLFCSVWTAFSDRTEWNGMQRTVETGIGSDDITTTTWDLTEETVSDLTEVMNGAIYSQMSSYEGDDYSFTLLSNATESVSEIGESMLQDSTDVTYFVYRFNTDGTTYTMYGYYPNSEAIDSVSTTDVPPVTCSESFEKNASEDAIQNLVDTMNSILTE